MKPIARIIIAIAAMVVIAAGVTLGLVWSAAGNSGTVYPGYPNRPAPSSPAGNTNRPVPSSPAGNTAIPASSPVEGVNRSAASPAGNAAAASNTRYSQNWSGYVAQGSPGSYSRVKASWIEPKVYRHGNGWQMESTWVGLDGASGSTVEQIGTEAQYDNPGLGQGTFVRDAWFEMYPGPSINLPHKVLAGNHMTASVVRHGNHYTLTLANLSRHWTDVVHQTGNDQNSSAEAIMEAPTSVATSSVIPLVDFRNVHFTKTTINGHSARSQHVFAVDMVNAADTAYLDTVSPISASGHWSAHWDRSR